MPTDLMTIPRGTWIRLKRYELRRHRERRTTLMLVREGEVTILDVVDGCATCANARRHTFRDDADQLDYLEIVSIAHEQAATVRELRDDEYPEAV
jgi:hypothetical protein